MLISYRALVRSGIRQCGKNIVFTCMNNLKQQVMEAIYTAVVTSKGGRNGHLRSSDGVLDMDVRSPKEFGGEGGAYTNPEQLFAAGWAACFNSSLQAVAKRKKMDASDAVVKATVMIGRDAEGAGYRLAGRIDITVVGMTMADAEYLLHAAHGYCPYSRAIKGNVDVELHAHVK